MHFFSPPDHLEISNTSAFFSFPSRGGGKLIPFLLLLPIGRLSWVVGDGMELRVHPHTALPCRAGTARTVLLVRGSEEAGRLCSSGL